MFSSSWENVTPNCQSRSFSSLRITLSKYASFRRLFAAEPAGYFDIVSKVTDFNSVVQHLKCEKKLILKLTEDGIFSIGDNGKINHKTA